MSGRDGRAAVLAGLQSTITREQRHGMRLRIAAAFPDDPEAAREIMEQLGVYGDEMLDPREKAAS